MRYTRKSIFAIRVHFALVFILITAVLCFFSSFDAAIVWAALSLFIYCGFAGIFLPTVLYGRTFILQSSFLTMGGGHLARWRFCIPLWRCMYCTMFTTPMLRKLGLCILVLHMQDRKFVIPYIPIEFAKRILDCFHT